MNTKRQPKGIPTGGEFAANAHDEAGSTLAQEGSIMLVNDGFESHTFAQIAEKEGIDISEVRDWASSSGYEINEESLIRVSEGDDPIERDDIATILRDGNNYDVREVTIAKYREDTTAVVTAVNTNLLWNNEYTDEELNHYSPVVEQTYKEWFNADLYPGDSWEYTDVEMVNEVPDERLTDSTAIDAAYNSYADFLNKTDPGTFNSPYIGSDLRKRIDNSRLVSERFNLTPGEVPSDLSKEKITDSEALAIAKELHLQASEIDGRDGVDLGALRRFQETGVLSISDTEGAIANIASHQRKEGTLTKNRSDRISALSGAMERWIDDRPVFEKDDEEN